VQLLPYSHFLKSRTRNTVFIEVVQSIFHDLLRQALPNIKFDENWYLQRYSDVANAVKRGEFASGHDHYIRAGYFEGRLPRRIPVDTEWYLEKYPDVQTAISRGEIKEPQEHFELYGFAETRLPSENWHL
jgi:hypothetical protein